MASYNYFSHDSNARNSKKMLRLRQKLGAEGYGIYWMLVERLRDEESLSSDRDYEMLSFDLRVDAELIREVIEDFGLFDLTDDSFSSHGLDERMQYAEEVSAMRSAAGKEGARRRWANRRNANEMAQNGKSIANERQTDGKGIALNKIKLKEMKLNEISFSSFSSFSVGNEELQEEQQEEIILSNFVFLKNIPNPQVEYKKFIAYNNTGGRVWNKMSIEEKDAALELWKQKPAQKERFDEEFKGFWQKIYSTLLSIDAPPEIRMDALSDGVNYTLMNGRFTIHCTSRLSTFIERNLDHFKGHILDYLKAKHCNGYTIHYFEIPVQNT